MRTRRLRVVAVLAATMAIVVGCSSGATPSPTAAPTGAGEWTPEFVDGVLQPLPDGFPNQAITMIVVDEAGSDDGIYARNFQSALDAISPVRFDVIDRPDLGTNWGTWEALKYVEEQPGGLDGYLLVVSSITGTTMDLLTSPVAQELDVSVDDENWVIITEQVNWPWVTRVGAPWGTDINQFVEYAKANPGEVRWISRGPGSSTTFTMLHYQSLLGIELKEIIGGSIEDILVAIGAGEGDTTISLVGSTMAIMETGRVDVMSCTGNKDPCPVFDVPNAKSVAGHAQDPWGSSRGFMLPPGTSDLHRAWLNALMQKAIEDQELITAREQLPGLVMVNLNDTEADEIIQYLYDTSYEIGKELGVLDPTVQ